MYRIIVSFPEPTCLRCRKLTKSTKAAEKVHAETQTEELMPPQRVKEEFEVENQQRVIGHIVIQPRNQEESQIFPESAANIEENPGVKQEEPDDATKSLVIDPKCRKTQQVVLQTVINSLNLQ